MNKYTSVLGNLPDRMELLACRMVPPRWPVKQPLDRSIHKLQIDRLRTHPAAPDATKQGRHQKDSDNQAHHEQSQQQRVGRQERESEERELPVRNVQQDGGLAANREVRQQRENRDQQRRPQSAAAARNGPRKRGDGASVASHLHVESTGRASRVSVVRHSRFSLTCSNPASSTKVPPGRVAPRHFAVFPSSVLEASGCVAGVSPVAAAGASAATPLGHGGIALPS